jgi:hypothetical protein
MMIKSLNSQNNNNNNQTSTNTDEIVALVDKSSKVSCNFYFITLLTNIVTK